MSTPLLVIPSLSSAAALSEGKFQKAAALTPGLTLLEEYGWIHLRTDHGTGGRPSTNIVLNPLANVSQNAQNLPFESFGRRSEGLPENIAVSGAPDEAIGHVARTADNREMSNRSEQKSSSGLPVRTSQAGTKPLNHAHTFREPPANVSQNPQKPLAEPGNPPPPSMTMEELALLEAEDGPWNADPPRIEPTAEHLRRADWYTEIRPSPLVILSTASQAVCHPERSGP